MTAHELSMDELFPRDAQHRYRLYFRRGDDLGIPVAAPDIAGLGCALQTFHQEDKQQGRRLADRGVVGILDAVAEEWVVLPWQPAERPVTFGTKERQIR